MNRDGKEEEEEKGEEEKDLGASRLESRKEMMENMMGRRSSGGLGSLMSQMMAQRGRDEGSRSVLLEKMAEIDQQLDRVEEKLDKLLP